MARYLKKGKTIIRVVAKDIESYIADGWIECSEQEAKKSVENKPNELIKPE